MSCIFAITCTANFFPDKRFAQKALGIFFESVQLLYARQAPLSERNIIVRDRCLAPARTRTGLVVEILAAWGRPSLLEAAARLTTLGVSTVLLISTAALVVSPAAAQKLKIGCHNLCHIMGLAVFFIISGLEPAFNVDLSAFGEIFFQNFSRFSKGHYPVPFRLFLFFTGVFIRPLLACGNGEIDHCHPLLGIPYFRVSSQITNEYYLVYTCHASLLVIIVCAAVYQGNMHT